MYNRGNLPRWLAPSTSTMSSGYLIVKERRCCGSYTRINLESLPTAIVMVMNEGGWEKMGLLLKMKRIESGRSLSTQNHLVRVNGRSRTHEFISRPTNHWFMAFQIRNLR